MKKFKIRCSAISNIIGGTIGLTHKQLLEMDMLMNKEKRTPLQHEKLIQLQQKYTNPVLPDGAKTYCKDWLKGQLLDYKHDFNSKYTDKGNIMEDESIDFIAEQLGYGLLMKNEEYFDDEFIMGTPDIILKDTVIDVKNSWDASTFPMFENDIPTSAYYWQLQGYMCLTKKTKARLIYCLMDTPLHLIEREARWDSIRQGYEELEKPVYDKFVKNLTYKNVDPKLRIKAFDIERNDSDIQKIKDRVVMCREYITKLTETFSLYDSIKTH
jgi:hypothetical protein